MLCAACSTRYSCNATSCAFIIPSTGGSSRSSTHSSTAIYRMSWHRSWVCRQACTTCIMSSCITRRTTLCRGTSVPRSRTSATAFCTGCTTCSALWLVHGWSCLIMLSSVVSLVWQPSLSAVRVSTSDRCQSSVRSCLHLRRSGYSWCRCRSHPWHSCSVTGPSTFTLTQRLQSVAPPTPATTASREWAPLIW
eukprot:COSAG02_NODE_562_length_20293_cov_37.104288_4_plen_193_part_00